MITAWILGHQYIKWHYTDFISIYKDIGVYLYMYVERERERKREKVWEYV